MKTSRSLILFLLLPFCSLFLATSCTDTPTHDAEGTFEATEITISAEASGTLLYLNLEEGDSVGAHRVVALIDTVPLALQRAQLEAQRRATLTQRPDEAAQRAALEQQIASARVERERTQRLLQEGAATQKLLDDQDHQIAALEKQLVGLRSTLGTQTQTLNRQADVIDAQIAVVNDKIARSYVRTPTAGTVLTKFVEAGEIVATGKPLFRLAHLEKVYLRAYFTSEQLASLRVGQNVRVVADYGDEVEKTYQGVVVSIAEESEFTPKTIQTSSSRANLVYAVRIAVNNDGGIKIGMHGKVHLQ